MKNTDNNKVLKSIAALGRRVAEEGGCLPSWACLYQPETPEALKKLRKKK